MLFSGWLALKMLVTNYHGLTAFPQALPLAASRGLKV
jgi:hypothetical protein